MPRLFKRIAKVKCWRESIPKDMVKFEVERLSPNTSLEISEQRIQFEINKSLPKGKKPKPNTCDITISNLSLSTRSDLETKPLCVQLDAGYDGAARFLFAGDLRFGMTKLDGATWQTLLQLGDGGRRFSHSRVNKSYGARTSVRMVLTDAAASMGLALPPGLASDRDLDTVFEHGHVSSGAARDKLTSILAPYGYHWSIQNGKLRVLKDGETSNTSPLPIDEANGMIGTPEFGSPPRSGKRPHMTVKMLLYPELTPGDLVQLTSKVKNGLFRIEQVKHQGDTHGGAWETEIEISPKG